MTLDTGLFCVVQSSGANGPEEATGLPGVRVSLPPGTAGRPDAVAISTFREDGWLCGRADAALVRVATGPAQILVTIYQQPGVQRDAPRLQLVRLGDATAPAAAVHVPAPGQVGAQAAGPTGAPAEASAAASGAAPAVNLVAAHVQSRGDVTVAVGDWVGDRDSKRWVEGFGIAPPAGIAAEDLEYQAVLGRGWLSPWAQGGQYCGSRGMALPLLGLRVRLRGHAAGTHECLLTATFVDGTTVGPVRDGAACETEALAPLEAFKLEFVPREGAKAAPGEAELAATAEAPASAATGRRAAAPKADPKVPGRRRK